MATAYCSFLADDLHNQPVVLKGALSSHVGMKEACYKYYGLNNYNLRGVRFDTFLQKWEDRFLSKKSIGEKKGAEID